MIRKFDFLVALYVFGIMVVELMAAKIIPIANIGGLQLSTSVAIFALQFAKLLGADIVFARLADTRLGQEAGLVTAIEGAVRDVQPDIVYTHCSADLHQDHAAAHHATMVACRRIARVYGYQSPSSTVAFAWS